MSTDHKVVFAYREHGGTSQGRKEHRLISYQVARYTTLRTQKPDSYYIEGMLSHEIGHMIGLGHLDSPDSLMKPFSPIEESYFYGRKDEATMRQYQKLYEVGN